MIWILLLYVLVELHQAKVVVNFLSKYEAARLWLTRMCNPIVLLSNNPVQIFLDHCLWQDLLRILLLFSSFHSYTLQVFRIHITVNLYSSVRIIFSVKFGLLFILWINHLQQIISSSLTTWMNIEHLSSLICEMCLFRNKFCTIKFEGL